MGSKANTWQKKLMTKAKAHGRKVRGVKQRFAIDGIKLDAYRAQPEVRQFARQPKTYGSVPSPR